MTALGGDMPAAKAAFARARELVEESGIPAFTLVLGILEGTLDLTTAQAKLDAVSAADARANNDVRRALRILRRSI